jgi:hypothetical protein
MRKGDCLAILGLICLLVFFFREAVLGGKAFFMLDIAGLHYPLKVFTAETIARGQIPLWNSYTFAGYPHLAGGQVGVFYPLNFLFLVLPTHIAMTWFIVMHCALAGVFMYILARELVGDGVAAFISALTFMFSGPVQAQIINLNFMSGGIWLPLIFFLFDRSLSRKSYSYAMLAGVIFGLQLLVANPQIAFYGTAMLATYSAYHVYRTARNDADKTWRSCSVPMLSLLMLLVVGLGLSAVQIIPTNELRSLSIRRGGLPYNSLVSFSLPPWQLAATMPWPDFWGKPLTTYRGLPNFWEFYAYIGLLPLMLIPFTWGRRANARVSFHIIMAAVSLILAFGGYTPLYVLLQYVLAFNFFRAPARWLFITAFSLSILAGFGFSVLVKLTNKDLEEHATRWPILSKAMALTFLGVVVIASAFLFVLQPGDTPGDRYRAALASLRASAYPLLFSTLLIGTGFLLLMAYLRGDLSLCAFKIMSVGLMVIDLLVANRDVNPLRDPSYFTQQYDSTAFLQKDTSLYRILPVGDEPLDDIQGLRYDVPAIYGLSSVHGGSALVTSRYAAFMDRVDLSDERLMGLLNVKYVIAHKDEPIPATLPIVYENEHLIIYENEAVLPRTFVVHEIEVIPSGQAILECLVSDDFDPQQTVILEERPPHLIAGQSGLPPDGSWARVISYLPHEVVVEAKASQDGFLFLADAYYPGWKAYVGGKEERIYAADYLFRAVFLPRGEHRVEFRYEPLSFKVGLAISSLTLLVLWAVVLVRAVIRKCARYPDAIHGFFGHVLQELRRE